MHIVGRKQEIAALRSYQESKKPEFVVVYGRRRVGKTFLVKEVFENGFCFYCTGRKNEDEDERPTEALGKQLSAFHEALVKYGGRGIERKDNWFDAFLQLEQLIENTKGTGKKVIFIDEMPWLDTPGSGFLSAFEYFWNSFASSRPDILLIACGSATSWIVKKLFENTGGLFNRVTKRMHLAPFTLAETEAYFEDRGIVMGRYQMVESYMIFGGIPFYLDLFEKKYGLAQNVDLLCFGEDALLRGEYRSLFATLFRDSENHHRIVRALASKAAGLTREEIVKASGVANNGHLTEALEDLALCGFVRKYQAFGKRGKGAVYQLSDPYTLFYHRFIADGKVTDPNFWANGYGGGAQNAWRGYAFEQVCLAHVQQIRQALGIGGIVVNSSAWRSAAGTPGGAQIDLVLDRADRVINLCEMKFSTREFEIDKAYCAKLESKARAFAAETKTNKTLHTTFVTTYGVKHNKYRYAAQSEVVMEDLFQ
ncbi:MAG: ATP-binding protein [Clostridiales Family XIII bacterium]|jgi:predicted AAA+ superfamily ATPase|nr:ATP-binding protein [Clostridiales Family XIII bacterium]